MRVLAGGSTSRSSSLINRAKAIPLAFDGCGGVWAHSAFAAFDDVLGPVRHAGLVEGDRLSLAGLSFDSALAPCRR